MPLGVETTAKLILLNLIDFIVYHAYSYQLYLSTEFVPSFDKVTPPIEYNFPSKPKQQPGFYLASYIDGILVVISSLLLILCF